MTQNKQTLMPWKKVFRLHIRAFRLLYKTCPQVFLSQILCTVWNALTPYAGIYLSARIIDELTGAKNPEELLLLVLITLFSAAAITCISVFLTKWKDVQSSGIWFQFKNIYNQKLFSMDFVSIDDQKSHELHSTIQQNRQWNGWGLDRVMNIFRSVLSSTITIFGGVSLTVFLFTSRVPEDAGRFTLLNHPLCILAIIVLMLAVTYISPMLSNKAENIWASGAEMMRFANRGFGYYGFLGFNRSIATDVRIYRQEQLCTKITRDNSGAYGSHGLFAKLAWGPLGLYKAASAAVSVVFTGFVYLFVCLKAWAGAFGIGSVTQYIASITKVSGGVSSLISTVGDMRNNASFLAQVFEFLDIPNTMYQGSLTVEKRRDRDYEVEFKNVSFKYPGSETYVLRNVNMKFKIGSRLAVVGMNGSGKTTFIKLLCRLYDPTEGEILLNGINIRKYNYLDYMGIFSVVFQDFQLFSLKLGENVAAGTDYDLERVEECLLKAGFGDRFAEFADGTETYLYKDCNKSGVNISGGEAQKIAIARTLYKDAPFLILDEPTAALDPIAEAEIYSKFNDIAGDKTAIYISHRLSSCKFCDEIAVFHEGAVIQQGTHAELVADVSGKYYELWQAQAQYYTESA